MSDSGKRRRLGRVLGLDKHPTIIVPLDDSLLSGPEGWLARPRELLAALSESSANAFLGFPGFFARYGQHVPLQKGLIVNLTASTTLGQHTRKSVVASASYAVAMAADAVAVHVNIGSAFEHEMLKNLGGVVSEAEQLGLPVVAIMYPRTERGRHDDNFESLRAEDIGAYIKMVSHVVRVGVDLGADVIKTQYTGDAEGFAAVVAAAGDVPVITAGGPMKDLDDVLSAARGAAAAGARGISFGRNVFLRDDPVAIVARLREVIDAQVQG